MKIGLVYIYSVKLFTAKKPEGIQYAGAATAEKLGNFMEENTAAPKEVA